MNDFYVVLPSNTHPNCTTSNYYVRLAEKLVLQGQWEVALTSVVVPLTYDNVPYAFENNTKMYSTWLFLVFDGGKYVTIDIDPGYYASVADINAALQRALGKQTGKLTFVEDPISRKVRVTFDTAKIKQVHLSEHLQYILGFSSRFLLESNTLSNYSTDITGGLNLLYVYTDAIEPCIVGATKAPLLGILQVPGDRQHGETIEKSFTTPQYKLVQSGEITSIEINIKHDTGRFVQFQSGKIVATLHFRKRRHYL